VFVLAAEKRRQQLQRAVVLLASSETVFLVWRIAELRMPLLGRCLLLSTHLQSAARATMNLAQLGNACARFIRDVKGAGYAKAPKCRQNKIRNGIFASESLHLDHCCCCNHTACAVGCDI
jgi:hypothetical protein